jgi:hypothetical protein
MKAIVLLLSLIVLTLTVTPCCAFENEEECALEQKQANEKQTQKDDCCKDCSPFYTCGTCVGFVLATNQVVEMIKPEVKLPIYTSVYLTPEIGEFYPAVWQPPKLG